MKLYLLEAYGGEHGYFVFADNKEEAIKLVKKQYLKENETSIGRVVTVEETEIVKGVVGGIDWTEPEPPIFEYYKEAL